MRRRFISMNATEMQLSSRNGRRQSLKESHWWDFARGFLSAVFLIKKNKPRKRHVIRLIDWSGLLVVHCFEVALTVISNAPKYCLWLPKTCHLFSKGHMYTALTTLLGLFSFCIILEFLPTATKGMQTYCSCKPCGVTSF